MYFSDSTLDTTSDSTLDIINFHEQYDEHPHVHLHYRTELCLELFLKSVPGPSSLTRLLESQWRFSRRTHCAKQGPRKVESYNVQS